MKSYERKNRVLQQGSEPKNEQTITGLERQIIKLIEEIESAKNQAKINYLLGESINGYIISEWREEKMATIKLLQNQIEQIKRKGDIC